MSALAWFQTGLRTPATGYDSLSLDIPNEQVNPCLSLRRSYSARWTSNGRNMPAAGALPCL